MVRNIMTNATELYFVTELTDTFAELFHVVLILIQQMQYQPQGGLLPYTRQFGKFCHRIFQQLR
jgi:hypothetical protein